MKYYILDLSPQNSLVKYLVDQGHTVFCISWKNPGAEERDLGMDDYLRLGLGAALDAVTSIVPQQKVHALGYCLGGTLLAIGAAAMARDGDDRLASLTLLAAQTDFTEPGELGLFIDESQVSLLEAQMAQTGYLTGQQMGGAFQLLRSNDLLWSRVINHYLLGEPAEVNDLMAWNADATRLPARMHSEYLRSLFLHDDLAQSRYRVGGRPISLAEIKAPVFLLGTLTDHVAPWRSVYKLHYLTPAEITFALTSGGHNAGIVSPPGNPRRHYQLLTTAAFTGQADARNDPDRWLAEAPRAEGSWWPAWHEWLRERSGAPVGPPRMGLPGADRLDDAPGRYVLEK
jgi:polyhydroxyalkanoate synthase